MTAGIDGIWRLDFYRADGWETVGTLTLWNVAREYQSASPSRPVRIAGELGNRASVVDTFSP